MITPSVGTFSTHEQLYHFLNSAGQTETKKLVGSARRHIHELYRADKRPAAFSKSNRYLFIAPEPVPLSQLIITTHHLLIDFSRVEALS